MNSKRARFFSKVNDVLELRGGRYLCWRSLLDAKACGQHPGHDLRSCLFVANALVRYKVLKMID
jgi:hypothetical protein